MMAHTAQEERGRRSKSLVTSHTRSVTRSRTLSPCFHFRFSISLSTCTQGLFSTHTVWLLHQQQRR